MVVVGCLLVLSFCVVCLEQFKAIKLPGRAITPGVSTVLRHPQGILITPQGRKIPYFNGATIMMAYAAHYGNDEWFDFSNATELERFAAQLEQILSRKWIDHLRRVYATRGPDNANETISCHEKVKFRAIDLHFRLHCNFGCWQRKKAGPCWISSELLPRCLDLTANVFSMQDISIWFGPRCYLLLEPEQKALEDISARGDSVFAALRTSFTSALSMAVGTCEYPLPAFLNMSGGKGCESITGLFHPGCSALAGPRFLQFRAATKRMEVFSPSLLVHDALNLLRIKLGGHPNEELGADVEVSMTWEITASSSLMVNDSVMNIPPLEKAAAPLLRIILNARWPSLHTHSTRDRALLLDGDLLKMTRKHLFMQGQSLAPDEQPTWSVGCEWLNPTHNQLGRALSTLVHRYQATKALALQREEEQVASEAAAPDDSDSDTTNSDSDTGTDSETNAYDHYRGPHQQTPAGRAAAKFGACMCQSRALLY